MKKIVVLCILLCINIFAQVDSLFSIRLNNPYEKDFVREVIRCLPESLSDKDIEKVRKFTVSNRQYGYYAIKILVEQDDDLVLWLESIDLTRDILISLNNTIDSTIIKKINNLNNFFFNYLQKNDSQNNNVVYAILAKISTFEQSKELIELFNFESDYDSRNNFLSCMAKFNSSPTDSIINLELQFGKSLESIYLLNHFALKKYNRYDFLPQLKKLPERIKQLRTSDNGYYADKILKELKTLIPYLEKKKKEKAPIGLPLDWGMVKETQN